MTVEIGNSVRFDLEALAGEGLNASLTLNSNSAMTVTAIDGDQATVTRQGVTVGSYPAKFLIAVEAP